MILNCISAPPVKLETFPPATPGVTKFRFDLARPDDNSELQQFSGNAEMPGVIRLSFDRAPDYLGALCVEGRHTEALVCRDGETGRLVATGHRAVKTAFINGNAAPVGYLSGLRVAQGVRSGQILSRGYACLREVHTKGPAQFYLTTIMEGNSVAKRVLLSGRFGLPAYHDFGRFCCMAVSLQGGSKCNVDSGLSVRRASAADGTAMVEFLNREGRAKQFFPEYRINDFGCSGGLLSHLDWRDIFLAFRGKDLTGVLAAWDQRAFRRWRVTGYAPWLAVLRLPFNLLARLRHMPPLPRPGSPLDYFILSLVCIQNNDRNVFNCLLEGAIRAQEGRFGFFLAGLHEDDPLLPELLARRHVPLSSRLYVVAWEDGKQAVQKLDRRRVPCLELGSL